MAVEDVCSHILKEKVPLSDFEKGIQNATSFVTLSVDDSDISVATPVVVENTVPTRTEYRCGKTGDLCVGYGVWYSFFCLEGFSQRAANKCGYRD